MGLLSRVFISGILCLVIYISSSTALVRRFNYDAILYEERSIDSRYVQFSRTNKDHWKNLSELALEHKLQKHAMVCTRGGGSWLAYPKEQFELGNGILYNLIIGEACITTDNVIDSIKTIQVPIKSLQPLGEVQLPLEAGVVVFSKKHFQSDQKLIVKGSYTGDIGSILYAGGSPWKVTAGSESVCIMPASGHRRNSVLCLIPTLDSSLKMKGAVKTVTEGCTGAKVRLITAQNCYGYGVHRIFPNTDFAFANMENVCDTEDDLTAGNDTDKKFNLIMELWKGRITHGIEEMENIKIPYEATYKQRVLWQVVNVFQEACPLVSPQYIGLIRNVFLMHLRSAWTKQPDLIGVEDDYWRHAYMFLTSCGDNLAHHPGLHDMRGHCMPGAVSRDGSGPDLDAYKQMFEGAGYDAVIEQVWLMFNLVTPYCNWINDFKTNDWTEIVSLLRRHFLDPLGQQWMNPGPWQKLYTIMFHGFNIQHQHANILTCIESALAKTPHYDPIGRTRHFLLAEKDKMEEQDTKHAVEDTGNSIDAVEENIDRGIADVEGGPAGVHLAAADDAEGENKESEKDKLVVATGDDAEGENKGDGEGEEAKEEAEPESKDAETPAGRTIYKTGKTIRLPIVSKKTTIG